jgi:hypothetical protein
MQFQFLFPSSTNFCNTVYSLTSTYFSADIWLQIYSFYQVFLLSSLFYMWRVIGWSIVRFLIGFKFPPSSFHCCTQFCFFLSVSFRLSKNITYFSELYLRVTLIFKNGVSNVYQQEMSAFVWEKLSIVLQIFLQQNILPQNLYVLSFILEVLS